MNNLEEIDASILQFAPKGSFYNTADEQVKKMEELWDEFFAFDRTIFALSTLLPGTAYSKGRMSHKLLANPVKKTSKTEKALIPLGLDSAFESKAILYSLTKESTPRALKNLLMLAGGKKINGRPALKRVNNARTRRIIMQYIFDRPLSQLESMAVEYKSKLRQLIRHALGKEDLSKLLGIGNRDLYKKYIGRYCPKGLVILNHLFGIEASIVVSTEIENYFPKIGTYQQLHQAAKDGDVSEFKRIVEKGNLPWRTVMGFRNTYKLDVPKDFVMEKSKMSARDAIQHQSAAKRAGADIRVDYSKQDIYDLFKIFYHKLFTKEQEDVEKIVEAIEEKSERKTSVDLGEIVVIFDASLSMCGADKRPLHPFLTAISLLSTLRNVVDVVYVGGKFIKTSGGKWNRVVVPSGSTALWRGLLEAAALNPKTVLVISDGYENAVKGMFEQVYGHLKENGFDFDVVHINPVFSAEVKGARRVLKDLKPLVLDNYKFLETNFIFQMFQAHREQVKQLLVAKYQELLGGEGKRRVT